MHDPSVNQATVGTQHYLFLDGLRGVAALLVLLMHWLEGHGVKLFGGSLLAVDYFFMLSGFVVTHAYQRKLRITPDFGGFIAKRIIRLYPLILLGFVLGLVRLTGRTVMEGDDLAEAGLLGEVARSLLMIPHLSREHAGFFPLNGAMWSLHFEYLAYIAFGLVLYRLRSRWLWVLMLMALPGALIWASDIFGGTSLMSALTADLSGYISGLARVFFAFTAGILVYRTMPSWSWRKLPGGRWLVLALVAPLALSTSQMPFLLAAAMLLIGFPYILAAGSQVENHRQPSKLDTLLGNLSYPLYALHVPIIWMMSGAFKALGIGFVEDPVWNGLVIVPVAIVASYLAFMFFDRPLRRIMTGWLARANFQNGTTATQPAQ